MSLLHTRPAYCLRLFLIVLFICLIPGYAMARDFMVTGRVTDATGNYVPNAKVSMIAGSTEFAAISGVDGSYSLRISGIYGEIPGLLELGTPHPIPFTYSVNIPFIINSQADIRFSVWSLRGQKIAELFFPATPEGSYRIVWDGCSADGAPVVQGLYIYAISLRGKTWSGKLIKVPGVSAFSEGSSLVPVVTPVQTVPPMDIVRFPVISSVTCKDYYPVRLTDITIARDTVIDFELARLQALPFKTTEDHISMFTESGYRPLLLKGINLGSSPPGYFPGEIAYAISPAMYGKWIRQMAEAGFNSIRIYTLHPPVFYEKLAEYNERHQDDPLLLFQGIWLSEIENPRNPEDYDLTLRTASFRAEIREVIDCIHGNRDIAFRPGRAYGSYLTDVSRWTAGYIIGREIMPQEVDSTNSFNPSMTSYTGSQFSISAASATDVFVTRMLDETVTFEALSYSMRHPVSISSWPTLDPLDHPTEIYTDEDKASFDILKISGRNLQAGLFVCYHAYPYYPNFISQQPSYRTYSDAEGPNSYLGYLTDLHNHYSGIPLVIGEFGVPSSWGSAHQSFSNMHHGGYSEQQQGEKNVRLMNNIIDAGCAGGFMFSWIDEWFKPTWIVAYIEAFGFPSGDVIIPTRQLWHNLCSPEQNFGLISFDQTSVLPFVSYQTDRPSGPLSKIETTNDNSFFYLNIETSGNIIQGDTMMIAFDTYLNNLGESTLPNGKILINRSEFLLTIVFGNDTARHFVTEAYDMNGLTPRFNLSDPSVQQYRSINSDGAPWKEMAWFNDGNELTIDHIGRIPMENAADFTPGQRAATAWYGNKLKIRIPWTMLYFYDPSQMKVNNGAETYDGGRSYEIETAQSDGIAVSVYYKSVVTSSTTRYNWPQWLIVPPTTVREKRSFQVVSSGLSLLPRFTD
ncbi:MAG: hypothetical protein IQL11_14595 [Bacteroidales bacterium]|nr:hypothetical protein [Bacteroidales bacterium]